MKVKNPKISIKNKKQFFSEVKNVWKKVESGKRVKKKNALYFSSVRAFRRVLTEKRIQMLKAIKHEEPGSIYQLAQILNRDYKNTENDIQLLVELGLVEIKKQKKGRKAHKPIVTYEELVVGIHL